MITVEYRVPLPLSLAEYSRALRYVVARVAESTTGVNPGEGVEILVNEPFGPDDVPGMPDGGVHTVKLLRFRSRLPALLRRVLPYSVTEINEESWFSNASGSRCKTVYRNPFLGNRFYLSIESNHLAGIDTHDNAVDLDRVDLARRTVIYLDIAGNVPRKLPTEDPSTYVSEKTGLGKLQPGWWKRLAAEATAEPDPDPRDPDADTDASTEQSDGDQDADNDADADAATAADDDDDVFDDSLDGDTDHEGNNARDPPHFEEDRNASKEGSDNIRGAVAADSVTGIADDLAPSSAASSASSSAGDSGSVELAPLHASRCMTCYKVVKMEFTGFGLRRFVQRWTTRAVVPNSLIDIHRKLFCWMDEWCDLTIDQIQELEEQTAETTRAILQKHDSGEIDDCATGADTAVAAAGAFEYEYVEDET